MIEYVYAHNIDTRVLLRAAHLLEQGKLVAFPTDSSWSIACSLTSPKGIEKLCRLKGDLRNKSLSVICSHISQVDSISILSNKNFKLLKKFCPGPYVFVLPARKHIEKQINMKRAEIGVRIPDHPIPIALCNQLEAPFFVITASKEMSQPEWGNEIFAEEHLFEQGWELEEIAEVDMVIDTGDIQNKVLSTVLDMTQDPVVVLREGIGKLDYID